MVEIINIDFKLGEYKPFSRPSYVEQPKWIFNKKATVNIKNDQKCFKYCLQYHKHKNESKKNPEEMYHFKRIEKRYPNEFDFKIIKFPVEV